MLETAGVAPDAKILDRQRRLKCWECRWRGRAEGPEPARFSRPAVEFPGSQDAPKPPSVITLTSGGGGGKGALRPAGHSSNRPGPDHPVSSSGVAWLRRENGHAAHL